MADPNKSAALDEPDEAGPEVTGGRRSSPSSHAFADTAYGSHDGQPPGVVEPLIVQDGDEGDDDERPDPYIGRVLSGLYKVENRIGEGGMGTVYMAVHIHLNKRFAVKVLSDRIATDKTAIERLRQEAIAASSIDHDNIVDVISFDATDDGDVFIVMELLEGASLADLVEKGPMSVEKALPIGLQLCQALHAAHENGIVHRDLKPENVFIVRKQNADFVKVLDFGISKVKSAEAEQVRMTKTGQLVGTPLYMSPEQAKGEGDIDRRADIYALGVMLYEMLTGTPPFEGGNYFQLLWKHGNEKPDSLSERNPDIEVPERLEAAILKTLEKARGDRPATMAELETALLGSAPGVAIPPRLMSMYPSLAPPAPEPASNRWPMVASVVALLAVGAGLAVGLGGGGATPEATAPSPGIEAAPDPSPVEVEVAAPEPEPEILPEGVEVPASMNMHFTSRPTGATVHLGEDELGVTPFEGALPTADGPIRVRFTRRGYLPEDVTVTPEEGGQVDARLRSRPRRGEGSPGGLGIKTNF